MRSSLRSHTTPIVVHHLDQIDYREAFALQQQIANARLEGGPDTLLLLEHPSTYTAGRRTLDHERPIDGTPVIDTNRGGKITWHGPGQLVVYPIIGLAQPLDVVYYVRQLEQAVIHVCQLFGLSPVRVEGRSGVWLPATTEKPERKISAIGIRVARSVSLHGLSINCDCDLQKFNTIVPCGIHDAGVTSLSAELDRQVSVHEIRFTVADAVISVLDQLPFTSHLITEAVSS